MPPYSRDIHPSVSTEGHPNPSRFSPQFSGPAYFFRLASTILMISWLMAGGSSSSFASLTNTTLVGRVMFGGPVQPAEEFEVTRDQDFCGETIKVQPLLIDEISHGVKNVVVSIEDIPNPLPAEVEGTTVFTNKNCAFHPRVGAMTVGKKIRLVNDDPMLHNTHIRIGKRTFVNVAQVVGGRPITKRVKTSGVLRLSCDKHKFMKGFLFVFDHPFFAVTNTSGEFSLDGIPPGHWMVTVWHETLGTMQTPVTIPEHGNAVLNVEYPKE